MRAVLIFEWAFFRIAYSHDNMTILHRCFNGGVGRRSLHFGNEGQFLGMIKRSTLGFDFSATKKRSASAYRAKHSTGCGSRQSGVFCINKLGVFLMLIWAHGLDNQDLGRSGGSAENIVVSAPLQRASGKRMGQGFRGVGSLLRVIHLSFHVSWATR